MFNWLSDRQPFCYFPEYFSPSMQTIDFEVDLERYTGTWFEQARKPQRFQYGCTESSAHYKLNKKEGKVEVYNDCITKDKGQRNISGYAVPVTPKNNKLKVYFTKWFGGSYWLLDLDKNYEWAIVGEPCKKFAWVLSRSANPPVDEVVKRVELLKRKGYDVGDIIFRGESDKKPF